MRTDCTQTEGPTENLIYRQRDLRKLIAAFETLLKRHLTPGGSCAIVPKEVTLV